MFQPSQHDVRTFFCGTWRKQRDALPLSPLEAQAAGWIDQHPEFHALLADESAALAASYTVDEGRENPFLHLSLHLAVAEQLQVDQPPGIRAAHQRLLRRAGSPHAAAHALLECLGEVIWRSQRDRAPPDPAAYLECIARRAGAAADD